MKLLPKASKCASKGKKDDSECIDANKYHSLLTFANLSVYVNALSTMHNIATTPTFLAKRCYKAVCAFCQLVQQAYSCNNVEVASCSRIADCPMHAF